ncbi:right-handed parallel beta-helix repeat-containing protein [Candidatus Micrarchaeota archaeon]|nr:right-handed parallel beta-helix repeat-containing protein [Candidatus Micrarchaeota archaeon]
MNKVNYLIIGLILVFLLQGVSGQTWYVNNQAGNCNDAGAGTSAVPLCHIAAANNRMNGGDTVYILPGTYMEDYSCFESYGVPINSTFCAKSGPSPSQPTKYIGLGNREDIKIMGSDIVSGWSLCTEPGCGANVYKASFPQANQRCESFSPKINSSYCLSQEDIGDNWNDCTTYSTDCWEDGTKWYIRSDMETSTHDRHDPTAGKNSVNLAGEFYFDIPTKTIYLKTFDGQPPSSHTIECSKRQLAHIVGAPGYNENITFENLTLMHSFVDGIVMGGTVKNINIIDNELAYNSGGGSCGNNPAAIIHHKDTTYCSSGYEPENLTCMKPLYIKGNLIHDQGSDAGAGWTSGGYHAGQGIEFYDVKDSIIEENEIYNVSMPFYPKGKVNNITFRNNKLYNYAGTAIFSNLAVENMKIIGNQIYNSLHASYHETGSIDIGGDYQYGVPTTTDNWTIVNNTFWNLNNDYGHGSGYGPMMGYQGPTRGHIIKNNVFANVKTDMGTGGYGTSYLDYQFESNHNLFYEPTTTSTLEFWQDAAYISLSQWKNTTSQDLDAIVIAGTAPLFNNASAADFSLKNNSQAIDTGTIIPGIHCSRADDNPTNPYPAGDTSCRHWLGSTPDLGAIEFGGTPAPCTNGNTRSCLTTENCVGTQTCTSGSWGSCIDTPNDGCPAIPCTNGETRNCTTTDSCPGTQTCTSGNWGTCNDTPNDDCPAAGNGSITVTHLIPTTNINAGQNQEFTYQTKVSCSGGYCGNVTATLDPTFGFTQEGAYSNNAISNELILSKYTAPENGTIESITAHLTYGEVVFAIYSESGNLLAQSAPKTSDNGWTTAPINLQVTAGNNYWLGWIQGKDGSSDPWRKWSTGTTGQGIMILSGTTYPNLPLTLPSTGNTNYKHSIYVTYSTDSNQTSKGVIPMNSGNPFYTTSQNPQTCLDLDDGQECTNTWSVIPTGTIGNTYSFFVKYTPQNTEIPSQNTPTITVTITENTGCTENWQCTQWSPCINGNQTRTCTDLSNCGTTNNKPAETQSCTECEFTDQKPCTTTQECPGIQVCNEQGQWGECYDVPDDNCPIIPCTNGETRNCTTNENCAGTETCVNGAWQTCNDIPNDDCPTIKELEITITPTGTLQDKQPFSVTVTEQTQSTDTIGAEPISRAKIEYAGKAYYTNPQGKVKIKANKDYVTLTASKEGYQTKTITLNIEGAGTPTGQGYLGEIPEEIATIATAIAIIVVLAAIAATKLK